MLRVQEYLHAGGTLASLTSKFFIKVRINEALSVVCLNYDQLNSPMNEEIVQECRALILNLSDWSILSWPFKKFFTLGQVEVPMSFDWNNFTAFDKLDGSLISIWHHHIYGWQIATRSVPDANTNVDDTGKTFRELVMLSLTDSGVTWDELTSFFTPGFSYAFELTGPENQIVVDYPNRSLTLIGIRNLTTLGEILPSVWMAEYPEFPLPHAQEYCGWDREIAENAVLNINPREREGYVLVDPFWNRIKIKSEAYCYMSSKRDALSKSSKARLELILSEKDDDVLPILPLFVQKQIVELRQKLQELARKIYITYDSIADVKDQKEFASKAKEYKYSAFLFGLRKHPVPIMDLFKATNTSNLLQLLETVEEGHS